MFSSKISLLTKALSKIALLMILMISNSAVAQLELVLEDNNPVGLFGIGIHQEKRFDIYVGALYSAASVTEASGLSDNNVAKRMSLRFLSKYSNRKMSRMWKQRIAMNNSKDNWRPLTKEIVEFASIFKQAMQQGDEINIDYLPNIGTKVYLNKTLFLSIKEPDFFNLLLNIWIGGVPPSEQFKMGIVGGNTTTLQTDLIAKFSQLTPINGRFDSDLKSNTVRVASAQAPSKNNTTPAVKNTSEPKVAESKPKQVIVAQKNESQQVADKQSTDTQPSVNSSQEPANKSQPVGDKKQLFKPDLGPSTVIPTSLPVEDKSAALTNQKAKQSVDKPLEKKAIAQPIKVAKLDPPKEYFDADLLAGSYTQELINTIRKYQSYPKKALAANEEGNVTVLVSIDKDGEIIEYELTERSGSRILNREVLRMIRKAAPFPKIPPELNLEKFEFEVPMNFKLEE